MLRPSLVRFLLVIALLFAQEGMVTHGISHVLAEQTQDQSLPHDQQCQLCAAYAQVGSALGGAQIHFDFAASAETALPFHSASFRSVSFAAFAARAPPYSA